MIDYIIGFILSVAIAYIAYKKESLSKSGFIVATIYGLGIDIFGGRYFFAVMISFFISSSIFSHFKKNRKQKYERINKKTGKRDFTQVIANGLPSLIFGLLYYVTKNHIYILGFTTALAAANADTWASEIGMLSKSNPVSIITWEPIEKGISGGISPLGTIASLLGAAFISIISVIGYGIVFGNNGNLVYIFLLSTLGGFLGSLIDSILGATIQAKYISSITNTITEKKYSGGIENALYSGISVFDNNIVNLSSGLLSSIIITSLSSLL